MKLFSKATVKLSQFVARKERLSSTAFETTVATHNEAIPIPYKRAETSKLDSKGSRGQERSRAGTWARCASSRVRHIDIREYYVDKNDMETKPGKKGIFLNCQQYQMLKGDFKSFFFPPMM